MSTSTLRAQTAKASELAKFFTLSPYPTPDLQWWQFRRKILRTSSWSGSAPKSNGSLLVTHHSPTKTSSK